MAKQGTHSYITNGAILFLNLYNVHDPYQILYESEISGYWNSIYEEDYLAKTCGTEIID